MSVTMLSAGHIRMYNVSFDTYQVYVLGLFLTLVHLEGCFGPEDQDSLLDPNDGLYMESKNKNSPPLHLSCPSHSLRIHNFLR
jgi:hypothetical protein